MDVDHHRPRHLTHNLPQHHLQQQLNPNQHISQQLEEQQQQHQQQQQSMNPATSTSSPSANSSAAAATGASSSGVMSASGTATATVSPAGGPQIRSRITVVCAECKRLKLKCDRRAPCGSCMKRDTVVRCIYSPAAAEKVDLHSLNNRLIQVEAILAMLTSGQQLSAPFQSAYPYPYSTPAARNAAPSTGGGNIHTNSNSSINGLGPSSSGGGGIPLVLPGSLPANFSHGDNANGGSSVENTDASNGEYGLNPTSDYPSSSLPGASGQWQPHPNANHHHHEHHHHYSAPPHPSGSCAQKDKLGMAPEDVVSIWLNDLDRGVAKEWLGDATAASSSDRTAGHSPTIPNGTAVGASTRPAINTTTHTTVTNTNTITNDLGYNFDYENTFSNSNSTGYIKLEPSSVDVELASSFQYSYPNTYPSVSAGPSPHRNSMVIDLDAADTGNSTTTVPLTFASTSNARIDSTPTFPFPSNSASGSNSNPMAPPRHQQHILLPALSIYYPLPSIGPPGTSPSSSAAFPAVPVPVPPSLPPRPIPQPEPNPPPSPSSHATHPLSPSSSGAGGLGSTSLSSAATPATSGTTGGYVFPPFSSSPLSVNNVIQIGSQQQQPQSPFYQQQNHPFSLNTSQHLATKNGLTKIKTKPQVTPALLSLLPSVGRCRVLLKEARSVVLGVRCVPLVPRPVDGLEGDDKGKRSGDGYGKMWDSFEKRCVLLLSGSLDGGLGGLSLEKERQRAQERERERERERARELLKEKERRDKAREARRARQIYFGGIAGLGGSGGSTQRPPRIEDEEEEEVDDERRKQKKKNSEHGQEQDPEYMRPSRAGSSLDAVMQEENRLIEEDLDEGSFAEEREREADEEKDNGLESLPFFATMCAVLAIGTSISTRNSIISPTSSSSSSSSSSPSALSPFSQHSSSSPNPSSAFLYALSQQALDVWDAHSRPDVDSVVSVHQRTEYLLGYVVGIVYLLLRMSGSGPRAQEGDSEIPILNEEEKTRETEKERESIRVLMNKMVSAARDAGLESIRDGTSPPSDGKATYSVRSGVAKPTTSGTKKRGTGSDTKTKTASTSKGKTTASKPRKSKLSWERQQERSAAAIANSQEEWRRMLFWEVLFYDMFTSDMLGHEPYVPLSVYTSLQLPTCSSVTSSEDGDSPLEDDEIERDGDDGQHLDVDGRIYGYLGSRYCLVRISSVIKARMADPECCCGYTLDQASKLEGDIVKWNRWFSRRLSSPSSSSSSSASSSSALASSKVSDEDDNDDKDEDGTLLLAQRAELAVWANILVVKIYTPFLRHAASAASSSASNGLSSSQSQRQRQQQSDAGPPASVGPTLTAAYQTTVQAAQAIVRASQCVMKISSLSKSPVLAKYTTNRLGHRQQGRVADSEVEVGMSFDVPMDMGVDMDNPLDVDMEVDVGMGVSVDVAGNVGNNVGLGADLRQAATQARKMGRMVIQHDTNQTIQDYLSIRESPPNSEGSASRVGNASSNIQDAPQKHARPRPQSGRALPALFDFYPLERVVFDAVVICAHAGLELAPRPAPGRSFFASSSVSSLYSSPEFERSPGVATGKVKGRTNPILDDLDAGLNILSDLCSPAAGRGCGWGWGRGGVGEAQKRVMEVLYHRAGMLRAVGGRSQPLEHHEARYGQKTQANASPTLIGDSHANFLKRKHDQIKLGGTVDAQAVAQSIAEERLVLNRTHRAAIGEMTLYPTVDLSSASNPSTSNDSQQEEQYQQSHNSYPFARTIDMPDPSSITNASPALPVTPSSHSPVVNFPQDFMQRNERQKLELTSALTSVATARLSAAAVAAKERKETGRDREQVVLDDGSDSEREKERKHPRKYLGSGHRPPVGVRVRHGARDELGGMRSRGGSVAAGGNDEGKHTLPLMTTKPRPFPSTTNVMNSASTVFGLQQKQTTHIQSQTQQQQEEIGGIMSIDENDVRYRSRSSSFVQTQITELPTPKYQQHQQQHASDNMQKNKFPMYDISVRQPQNQLSPVHSPFTPRSVFDHTHNIHNSVLYDQSSAPQAHPNSSFSSYNGTPTSSGEDQYSSHHNSGTLVSSPFSSASIANANGPPSSSGSPFTTSSVASSSGAAGPHPSTPTFNATNNPTLPPIFGPLPHPPTAAGPPPGVPVVPSAAPTSVVGYFNIQGGSFDHRNSSLSEHQHHGHHHQQQQQTHLQQQHQEQVGHGQNHAQISLGVELGMEQSMVSLSHDAGLYDKHPQSQHSQHQQHIYDVKPQLDNAHFLPRTEERQEQHLQQLHAPQRHHQLSMAPPPTSSHTGYEDETMDVSGQNQSISLGMAVSSAWPTASTDGSGGGAGHEQHPQQTQNLQQNTQSFWGNDPNFRFYA